VHALQWIEHDDMGEVGWSPKEARNTVGDLLSRVSVLVDEAESSAA
jgi:hypothetical protein